MHVPMDNISLCQVINVAIRCPHCGHFGTFVQTIGNDIVATNVHGYEFAYLGIRKCPNQRCQGHLFFIADGDGDILLTSPSETIPFDKENIPVGVLGAFEEAIKCHSNSCFVASAIMIRKTLEEICHDRGAKGRNLSLRLQDLGTKILIPKELLNVMDDLRLLGNDAAHIEAKTFNEVGKDEIGISLEFTKEILKAVYQYENLLQKMKALKEKKDMPQRNV